MDSPEATFSQHEDGHTWFPGLTTSNGRNAMGHGFLFDTFNHPPEAYGQHSYFPASNLPYLEVSPFARARNRVSLACIPCRNRHAKCDATLPACSQCRGNNRACSYAQSRRGRNRPALECRNRTENNEENSSNTIFRANVRSRSESSCAQSAATPGGSRSNNAYLIGDSSRFERSNTSSTAVPQMEASAAQLDLYYTYFHDAHPVVLPRQFLDRRLETNRPSLQNLLPVMEYTGSLFATKATANGDLRQRAERMLLVDIPPPTGFTVLALLILAITTHSNNELSRGREIMDRAIQVALDIKLNSSSFAAANGEDCPVLEESWRRTWWFLYVSDGIFAGIHHCSGFSLYTVPANVHIPCEEAEYRSGEIPQPRTLEEYNAREFAGEEIVFSSFAYLIDLGHAIGVILGVGTEPGEPFDPYVTAADAILINWDLYLPKHKHLIIQGPGKIDEILFLAHVLHNTLKITLHRPRSHLSYSLIESISKCATPPSQKLIAEQQRAFDFHSTKVLEASGAGVSLFTLPSPFIKHTPIVICALNMSILAQLAACRLKLEGVGYSACRDRIRLGLGVIKAVGEIWPIARLTLKELQVIARETIFVPTPMVNRERS